MPKSHKDDRKKSIEEFEALKKEAHQVRKVHRQIREDYKEDPELMAMVRQDLINDLLRVFKHPCNPWRGWAASRQRYRDLGHYPEIMVTDAFGNHQEFQRAAGLRDTRGTSKVKNLLARIATEKVIETYAKQYIEPYYGTYDKYFRQTHKQLKQLMVVSDVHGRFCDPFAWVVFLDLLKTVQPNVLVLNGDIVDFPSVGRYTQIPGAGNLTLQAEIDYVKDKFRQIREIFSGPITWHIGNHEQRLARYLADASPALADLDNVRYDVLFGVKDFKIQLVFGGNWLAPYQSHRSRNIGRTHKIYYDSFVVTHGTALGPQGARKELEYFGLSGASGHTHRPGIFMQGTEANPGLTWMNPGMLANKACAKDYRETRVNEWGMGVGVVTIDPKTRRVIPNVCIIHEDLAVFAGKVYRPTAKTQKERAELWS